MYSRCLEIYQAPRRLIKYPERRDPLKESILPPLEELRPFPSNRNMVIKVNDLIRCIEIDPKGEFVTFGSDNGTLYVIDALNGMELYKEQYEDKINDIKWGKDDILFVAVGNYIHCIKLELRDNEEADYSMYELEEDGEILDNKSTFIKPTTELMKKNVILSIHHPHTVKTIAIHKKGQYIACVIGGTSKSYCIIHHIPKKKSQNPFKRVRGVIGHVIFHPTQPSIIISTQMRIIIFNLQLNKRVKTMTVNTKFITSIDIHPNGEHLLVSSFDNKCFWYDLQMGDEPYKTLKMNNGTVRQVRFHKSLPLFASIGDDAMIQVMHGMVYKSIVMDATIIPLIKLSGHEKKGQLGGTDITFHPFLPWVYSTGADGTIQWYSDWF